MLRRALPFVLVLGCSHPRPSAPPPPPTPQLTIHIDPSRFKADATLTIELVIGSGYSCSKHYPMPELPPLPPTEPAPILSPAPSPCMAPPPDLHEQYAEPVAGRSAIVIASGQLVFGRDFTVIVTGPAAAGCDLVRGTARGAMTGAAIDVPPLELVTIPQACPA